MKKTSLALILSAVILLATGCNSEKAPSSTDSSTTTTTPVTSADITDETSETTTETTTDTSADTEDTAATDDVTRPQEQDKFNADNIGIVQELPLSKEDAAWGNEYSLGYDFAYIRSTNGIFISSDTDPDLFDIENYTYNGNHLLGNKENQQWIQVKAGDEVGGLTVKSASVSFMSNGDGTCIVADNNIELDGEITLSGYMTYGVNDGVYVADGDLTFYALPASMADFPMVDFKCFGNEIFDLESNFAFYSDAVSFACGNVINDGLIADAATVMDGSATLVPVKVTLTDMILDCSDQFGTWHTTATIKAIEKA